MSADSEDRSERLHGALCGCGRGATSLWDSLTDKLSDEELEAEIARAEADL